MTNREKIIDYLKDGDWHCFATPGFFMKDDRTRISELRRMGYTFDERGCDGRCNVSHNSKLLMRRLVSAPQAHQTQNLPRREEKPGPIDSCDKPKPLATPRGWSYYPPEASKVCCLIFKASQGRLHAGGCETQKAKQS